MQRNNFEHYSFEDLEVWKIGMEIIHGVYNITKKFPKEELYSLSDQLKRASVSVVLNIAEGSGQSTAVSFCHYINMSKSSALECIAALRIALQEGFINKNDSLSSDSLLQAEYFKLIAFEKYLKSKKR